MPFFRYYCDTCETETSKLQNKPNAEVVKCKQCDGQVRQVMGEPSMQEKITTDEYKGKSRDPNIKRKLHERAQAHYRDHIIPRTIEEKGKKFAVEEGILNWDGTPRKGRS